MDMFCCGTIILTDLNTPILKVWSTDRVTSVAVPNDGHCEATIPVVKGHHVT